MRSNVLSVLAVCLAHAVGTTCAGQITAASLPAPVTETELNAAKQRCARLRFFMHEREALELLGLARFDRPGAGTIWDYSYSQGYELGNGHWLLLWYSRTSLVSDPPKYGLEYVGLDGSPCVEVDNTVWSEVRNADRYGAFQHPALTIVPTGVPRFEVTESGHTNVWLTVAVTNNTPSSHLASIGVIAVVELTNPAPFERKPVSAHLNLVPFGTALATVGCSQDMLKSQCVLGADYARLLSVTEGAGRTNADRRTLIVGRIQQQ